jgi:hypothetical protein
MFVPILTEPYRRRVESSGGGTAVFGTIIEDGWVQDEWQIALHLATLERIKFLGVWRSGPAVPFPFNTANVCDFRDDSLYLHAMNRDFPTRFVTVVGLRKDNTFRAFGPIKRSESAPFVESLRRTNEFETIALVHVRPERAVR